MTTKNPGQAKEIGARIAQARSETGGMTQRELAELLGVSVRSVEAYEQGETIPWRFGHDLERILGRPMAWFWYGRDEPTGNAENLMLTMLQELRALTALVDSRLSELESGVAALASAATPQPF